MLEKKDYDRAIAQFSSAIGLDPAYAAAYSARAFAYYRKGDLDRALQDVNEAFKRGSKSAGTYNTRALVLHAKRDYDEAIADLTQAIRVDPAYHHAYSNRGRTYNAKKEFDRAISDLNEAMRLNPTSPHPYWNRAISYENKRDFDKALADWRTTLRLDPDNQNAIKAIRRLEQQKVAPAAAPKARVALVIGNADYKFGGRLANPVNDATDFAAVLRKLGFEVIEGRNLDKRGMEEKIREFARKLDKASTGLFFYAGHGIQVDGDNWLIPIDARIESTGPRNERTAKVKTATINIAQVLSKMEAEQRVNLIFLDACRDNPFGREFGARSAQGARAHSERGRHADRVRHQALPCRPRRRRPQQPVYGSLAQACDHTRPRDRCGDEAGARRRDQVDRRRAGAVRRVLPDHRRGAGAVS